MDPDPDLYLAISAFFRLFINQAVSDWHFKKKLAKCFFLWFFENYSAEHNREP